MEKTYHWIYEEFTAKYNASTAHQSSISTFTKGSHPIPGDGYNPESKNMDTWRQGIPAGYEKAGAATAKPAAKSAKPVKKAAKSGSSKKAGSPKKAVPVKSKKVGSGAKMNGKAKIVAKKSAKKTTRRR